MATLALSLAGQVVGGALGGPIGATIGRALGALAGSAIDSAVFGDKPQIPPTDIRLVGSTEGGAIPRVYGWSRVGGNIIWATHLEAISAAASGSKGGGGSDEEIVVSFALALSEGEVHHIGRIWADGKPLETEGLTIRFHRGTANQQPDGFMAAMQGTGNAPAYRGVAYLVFERLPVARFGNRIPNISVEICRVVGDLEPAINAMCVIPGATEFGYDPAPRVRVLGPGQSAPENTHLSAERSDWDVSIDELVAVCPNLKHVALIIAWFGTDLRAGHCVVEPRVEASDREIEDVQWSVAGLERAQANVVSRHAGGPAYGGTPSDGAVIAAIEDLKARGISVTIYPFVMMDVPHANGLIDPYTQSAGQPPYPWRGRITCDPAPGVAGSPDGTSAAASQVTAFMDNGYTDFILHYAQLAVLAGGVEAFVIGSEMRELTFVRSGPASFPYVDALVGLAGAVRAIVGSGTKLTYAADWSEYSGLQPAGTGDKLFHLDPLWADANIDAVGIDNYMPLADWRDGENHLDAEAFGSIHDLDYLKSNIAGGEGYHWFYASDADRAAQIRTPISDGAHGEPWVYRFKDLVNWWSNPHYNRIGGVRQAGPTGWVPGSKPIWMNEFGCGAVDKGPNAPNAFGDPKSTEDKRPPFSSGAPDMLIQRQALRAFHRYWQGWDAVLNPVSQSYSGPMVDPERLYLWCWDARPFPAFPALTDIWADEPNYTTGHWLNGRLGMVAGNELLGALATEYGVATGEITATTPAIEGLAVDAIVSLRDVSGPITQASGLVVRANGTEIDWIVPDARRTTEIGADQLMAGQGALIARKRADPDETVGRLTLSYIERARDYQTASVSAVAIDPGRDSAVQTGLVLDPGDARHAVQTLLESAARAADTLDTALPPSQLAIQPGDVIAIEGLADGPFVVTEARDGLGRDIGARGVLAPRISTVGTIEARYRVSMPSSRVTPVFALAHLPDGQGGTALVVGAYAQPWPGTISIRDGASGAERAELASAAALGALNGPVRIGPSGRWWRGQAIDVTLFWGHLASQPDLAVLAGANRIAICGTDGDWEVIGFADAELIAPNTYRLNRLLRGLAGTRPIVAEPGGQVLVLNGATRLIPIDTGEIGSELDLRAYAGIRDADGSDLTLAINPAPALPLPPVHLRIARDGVSADIAMGWIRQSRIGADSWPLGDIALDFAPEAYRAEIYAGSNLVRSADMSVPGLVYSAAQQTADFGGPAGALSVRVAQLSTQFGPGHWAQADFS